jgi:Homeodomain-like domain
MKGFSKAKHLKSRKHHSKEYRIQAVELLLAGLNFAELAAELHLGASTLKRWKEEYLAAPPAPIYEPISLCIVVTTDFRKRRQARVCNSFQQSIYTRVNAC